MACDVSECVAGGSEQIPAIPKAFFVIFISHQFFQATQLQLFQCDTFCLHARMFMELAVSNKWKTSQKVIGDRHYN